MSYKSLQANLSEVITLEEAQEWIEENLSKFGITAVPQLRTLRQAAEDKRLLTVKKGRTHLTDYDCVIRYMSSFDPQHVAGKRRKQESPS